MVGIFEVNAWLWDSDSDNFSRVKAGKYRGVRNEWNELNLIHWIRLFLGNYWSPPNPHNSFCGVGGIHQIHTFLRNGWNEWNPPNPHNLGKKKSKKGVKKWVKKAKLCGISGMPSTECAPFWWNEWNPPNPKVSVEWVEPTHSAQLWENRTEISQNEVQC